MHGLSLFFPIFIVLFGSIHNAYPSSHNVYSAREIFQKRTAQLLTLGALNVSSAGILDKLKWYEDSLTRSFLQESKFSNATCYDAVVETLLGIIHGKIWALKMKDSSSVLQSGLLAGNLWDLGSYDECVSISVDEEGLQFDGQHCLINLNFALLESPALNSGVLAALGGSISYTFSLCFPSICSHKSLQQSLSNVSKDINHLLAAHNYSVTLSVDEGNCHTIHSPPLTTAEICGIVVPVLFIGIALACTILDLAVVSPKSGGSMKGQPKAFQYALAFSYYRNGKRLMDTRVSDDAIQVLHSLKFICIAWVAIGHRFKVSVEGPLLNTLKVEDYIKKWSVCLLLNAPLSVDVFFVISGILNTYSYLNSSSRGSKTILGHIMGYIHRYVRLTPAYALMMLVTATWLYRLGDGPYWNVLVGDARYDCTHYWWTGLLYINNYYNPNSNCMLQSWYLAVDMQLFWLSPLVLYSLWRWPKVGLAKLAILVVVSIIIPFYVAWVDEIKAPIPLSLNSTLVNTQMDELYMPTHTKTISYVLGMLGGFVLQRVKRNTIKISFKPLVNVTIWVLAVVSMVYGVFGGYEFFQLDSAYNQLESSLYIAFYRLFWSVGIVWIIVACTTGHGGFINSFLSMKVWMPLGRLTYCVYLTHAAVILYDVGGLREPQYFSYYNMFVGFLGELVIATAAAVVLSLTIESPTMAVEKILRGGGGSGRQKRNNIEANVEKNVPPRNGSAINLPNVLSIN